MPLDNPPPSRVHVYSPQLWGNTLATDYWAFFNDADQVAGGGDDLGGHGWPVATGYGITGGAGADLLSSSDIGSSPGFFFDTAGDALDSPAMFGDFSHGRMVQELLGYFPTKLTMDCYARFVANNNETATGFGFIQDGGTPLTIADHLAYIFTDGTNFGLREGEGPTSDAGATDDTDAHLWRIILTGTTAEWFIDGTSQGTITLLGDQFPVSFGIATLASTGANDPVVAWVHIFYE